MKRFEFNLEKVLLLKKHNEEFAKIEFAKVLQKKTAFESEIQRCLTDIEKTESLTEYYISNENNVDYKILDINDRYIQSLRFKILENYTEIEKITPELNEKEGLLKEAVRERKILDKIRDKKYSQYLEELEYEETEMLDEVSSNMFLREWRQNDRQN